MVDVPYRRKKEAVDKIILVDMMVLMAQLSDLAAERTTVVLVSGDGDFAYGLSHLRQRGVRIVVIAFQHCAPELRMHAHHFVDWDAYVPGELLQGRK